MTQQSDDGRNLLAVNTSLLANALLAVAKTVVGIVGHSPALLADGVNSTSDVVYLAIVRTFMALAGKPPDREHPFGHRQLESVAAVVVGAFVVTTGVVIFYNATEQVYCWASGSVRMEGANLIAFCVAMFTLVLKIWLTIYTNRVGRTTGSIVVLAIARDHRNDIFSISAAAVGIAFSRMGYVWVDPLAATIVALVIVHTGISIIRESSADLMNVLPGEAVGRRIRRLVQLVDGVQRVEDVHVHRIGLYLLVGVTIGIDGTLTVAQGDRIASRVEEALSDNMEYLRHVSVHYHPAADL
jgi:cation diffusion facilitator family transporter